jgi:hypothetical protein
MRSVHCNICGATLQVDPSAQFITCAACGGQLELVASGRRLYSEPAGLIGASGAQPASALEVQVDLNRLDLAWQRERERYMARGHYGTTFVPTRKTALRTMRWTIALAFGFWLFASSLPGAVAVGAPLWGPAILLVFGLATGISLYRKASAYDQAQAAYLRRRAARQAELR